MCLHVFITATVEYSSFFQFSRNFCKCPNREFTIQRRRVKKLYGTGHSIGPEYKNFQVVEVVHDDDDDLQLEGQHRL